MGLIAKEKRAAIKVTAPRYQKAPKRQKGIILDEFAELTGYKERGVKSFVLTRHRKRSGAGLFS
jgi:hypothetical protein